MVLDGLFRSVLTVCALKVLFFALQILDYHSVIMTDSEYTGGYDYNFTDVPDDLICQVCHCVARQPHQVDCCGKIYCKACIERTKRKRAHSSHDILHINCPNCRAKAHPFRDQRSARHIKLLKMSCENESEGCMWTGELANYEPHKSKCEFNQVTCPNVCGAKLKQNELNKHVSRECPKRKRKCRLCKMLVIQAEMANHHEVDCLKVKVLCPNACNRRKMLREKLPNHRSLCEKEIVPCSFADSGCTVKVVRHKLQKHLDESKDQHLTLACSTVAALKKQITIYKLKPIPVTVKIPNFSTLKQNNDKWESPVFGMNLMRSPRNPWEQCKLLLEVYPNGIENCLGTHLSVILKVEIDDRCAQFYENIQLSLLCQSSGCEYRHVSKEIEVFHSPLNSSSPSFPISDFISHEELQQQHLGRKYLKNDCAYFRVSKVSDHYVRKSWLQCTFDSDDDDHRQSGNNLDPWSFDSDSFSSSSFESDNLSESSSSSSSDEDDSDF